MRRRTMFPASLASLAGSSLMSPRAWARTLNGFDLRGALVPLEAIEQGGPPRDGIPSIDSPRFVAPARSGLKDADRVLGLERGGVRRAYPVRILNWHEVVNDRLGSEAVAVTYCPLCGSGMAFDARVGGQPPASFGVSGLLYNSDVLLYDRGSGSLWSQILEQAVAGPMKGTRLTPVPLTHTSWADWRARHPRTEVLSADTGHQRDYARDPYAGYDSVPRLLFEVQHRDQRLPLKEWVLGVRLGGQAKAYPFSALAGRVDARGRLEDRVGGVPVTIRFDPGHRTAEALDANGQALPSLTVFWFAWVAFHPKTEVLAAR